jgi:outer membrane protein assembly factor BamB
MIMSRYAAALIFICIPTAHAAGGTANWPQFRGPNASGVSKDPAPVSWDIKSGEGVRWQTPIPGLGHASPVIWGDRIYIATAVKPGDKPNLKIGLYGDIDSYQETELHQWRLLCLDKSNGTVLWNNLALETVPRTQRHTKATHCNSTPATDGKHIVAIFGSEGVFGFDMKGNKVWHQDLGKMDSGFYSMTNTSWGFGSSPVLYKDKVIVQCDVLSEQYIAAYDVKDGHQIWKTPRADVPTWSTPLVATSSGPDQVIANGWKQIGGYDLKTGKQLWSLREGGDVPVASPILAKNMVILTSGHGNARPIRAIRLDAKGDITPSSLDATNKAIVWTHRRGGDYLQTPVVVKNLVWGALYGVITCFDVDTGQVQYSERIGAGNDGFTASPVAAGDKLYFAGERGDVFVVPAEPKFSVIATNQLDGLCLSTPAISEGTLFFRTTEKLVAIGNNH